MDRHGDHASPSGPAATVTHSGPAGTVLPDHSTSSADITHFLAASSIFMSSPFEQWHETMKSLHKMRAFPDFVMRLLQPVAFGQSIQKPPGSVSLTLERGWDEPAPPSHQLSPCTMALRPPHGQRQARMNASSCTGRSYFVITHARCVMVSICRCCVTSHMNYTCRTRREAGAADTFTAVIQSLCLLKLKIAKSKDFIGVYFYV